MAAGTARPLRRRPRKFRDGLQERLSRALVAFARHQFRLARRQPDGASLRDHLEAASRRGRRHPGLDGPPLPPAAAHLWAWFAELHAARPPGASLAFSEIAAWAALTGETPTAREVAALRALDRVWLEESCF